MSTNFENVQAQMRKGILEYCILHIISRGEVYASDLIAELREGKIMVVEGTLYPLLSRLKKAELLDYYWLESKNGPPRKYYKLTSQGKSFLNTLDLTWKELTDSVDHITKKLKK